MQGLRVRISNLSPLADQAFASGGNLAVSILAARALGVEDFGAFILFLSFAQFALMVQQSAIIMPLLSHAPRREGDARRTYVRSYIGLQIVFTVLALALLAAGLFAASFFEVDIDSGSAAALLAVSAAQQGQEFYRRTYYALRMYKTLILGSAIVAFGQIVGIAVLWYVGEATIENVLWVMAAGFALGAAIGLFVFGIPTKNSSPRELLAENSVLSRWLVPSAFVQWAGSNGLLFVAAGILGPAAAGALRAAQSVTNILNPIFISLENALPVTAGDTLREQGNAGLFSYVRNRSVQIGFFSLLAMIPVFVFAKDILRLAYGAEYSGFANLLRGFCILYVAVGFALPFRVAIRAIDRARTIFLAYVAATVLTLAAAPLLIDTIGLLGVIAAMMISQAILQCAYLYEMRLLARSASKQEAGS